MMMAHAGVCDACCLPWGRAGRGGGVPGVGGKVPDVDPASERVFWGTHVLVLLCRAAAR